MCVGMAYLRCNPFGSWVWSAGPAFSCLSAGHRAGSRHPSIILRSTDLVFPHQSICLAGATSASFFPSQFLLYAPQSTSREITVHLRATSQPLPIFNSYFLHEVNMSARISYHFAHPGSSLQPLLFISLH